MAPLSYAKQLQKLEQTGKKIGDLRSQESQIRALINSEMGRFIRECYAMSLNNADIGRMIGATAEAVRQHAERNNLVNPRALTAYKHPTHVAARRRRRRSVDAHEQEPG